MQRVCLVKQKKPDHLLNPAVEQIQGSLALTWDLAWDSAAVVASCLAADSTTGSAT